MHQAEQPLKSQPLYPAGRTTFGSGQEIYRRTNVQGESTRLAAYFELASDDLLQKRNGL